MRIFMQLQKLDRTTGEHPDGNSRAYAVFAPSADAPGSRARPKLTLDVEAWEILGQPTSLAIDVEPELV